MFRQILKRTLLLPKLSFIGKGNYRSIDMAIQLDVALMSVGFKLSKDALDYIKTMHPVYVETTGEKIIDVLKELVGDHVKHNVYFKDFPEGVPDTLEFWMDCVVDALNTAEVSKTIQVQLAFGSVNLLDLPKYGKYLHTYEEMVAAHEEFIPYLSNKFKIIDLGDDLEHMKLSLYHNLAESNIPLNPEDRELLVKLATECINEEQPKSIPIRENKALINTIRIKAEKPILINTVTDILRLACALSDGDVTLTEVTKFKSFPRPVRKLLLKSFDSITVDKQLQDISKYRERWKRLAERIHPYDYNFKNAHKVFDVVYKKIKIFSDAQKIDQCFEIGQIHGAIYLLGKRPGVLFRNLDRILRNMESDKDLSFLLETLERVGDKVATRVLLSVREHLNNRFVLGEKRIFANSKGTVWVAEDNRDYLGSKHVNAINKLIDSIVLERLPFVNNLIINDDISQTAIPLSDKNKADGFMIMPRGSVQKIKGPILRFFMYWKQLSQRTDYDLSVQFLNSAFENSGHISYTRLRGKDKFHSGDITDAPNGATEFIDINLDTCESKYIIPQVLLYSGEGFDEVLESFFGFMERDLSQFGKPFEPRTVTTKSDLRGKGRVVYPIIFIKGGDGNWTAKWMHLYSKGRGSMNMVEGTKVSSAMIAKAIVEKDYLLMDYLINLLNDKSNTLTESEIGDVDYIENLFLGLINPGNLTKETKVITLNNLNELIV